MIIHKHGGAFFQELGHHLDSRCSPMHLLVSNLLLEATKVKVQLPIIRRVLARASMSALSVVNPFQYVFSFSIILSNHLDPRSVIYRLMNEMIKVRRHFTLHIGCCNYVNSFKQTKPHYLFIQSSMSPCVNARQEMVPYMHLGDIFSWESFLPNFGQKDPKQQLLVDSRL